MFETRAYGLLVGLIVLFTLVRPAAAFGAGNIASISKVEGQNWRHGDIEDALLSLATAHAIKGGKLFNKLYVSRVYFGNWLRDYSQAIDVATLKAVSGEGIRLLLCVLGFLTFGKGSGEFEVTAERVGCYRPEDHIDNPKGYGEGLDPRDLDPRLRGPVDEEVELAIDPETGMKNYIANENIGIVTSARHVRKLFRRCIDLGRRYKRSGHKPEMYEALRLLGTGLHCLEDFFAHSNYTELALIEMRERDVFPHVGRNTKIRIEGSRHSVYPIVTGTFGGVDFLHSVTGEVSDKLTQNEIDELEGTLIESQSADTSLLRDLLSRIPSGIFGRNESEEVDEIQSNATAAQMENVAVSPRDPEEFTIYVGKIYEQIMPVIRFHDRIIKDISNAVEKIPILPKIIEQLEEQLSVFVFSIIAPFIVPLIDQIKNELKTGSEEIIHSSESEQHIVFNDDDSSDPTHSMLSKDHFSNILNEIAGRTAAKMLQWAVPQLMDAIDDESVDVDRLLTRIIYGVLHHPAQRYLGEDGISEARQLIFASVEEWWRDMGEEQRSDYRGKLSRDGVLNGENHREGVYDTGHGHGCSGKLKMQKQFAAPETIGDQLAGHAATAIFGGATGALAGVFEQDNDGGGYGGMGMGMPFGRQPEAEGAGAEESGGFGGFLSAVSRTLFGGGEEEGREPSSFNSTDRDLAYGYSGEHSWGGERQTSGYGYESERRETRSSYTSYETRQSEYSEYGHRSSHHSHHSHHSSSSSRRGDGEERSSGGLFGGGGYYTSYEGRREDEDDEDEYGRRPLREGDYGTSSYGY
ncbi:hypothetical protein ESCO_000546 [Escovopsis weberi]|uniref:Het-C-domain-containing protein n=1 Tax=Escovopsis weberi TaxID=150374 RepID=A0A0M8N351_ESCWE|nr:hypothetical protein ESCO_000546 [Escovopsis weberi]